MPATPSDATVGRRISARLAIKREATPQPTPAPSRPGRKKQTPPASITTRTSRRRSAVTPQAHVKANTHHVGEEETADDAVTDSATEVDSDGVTWSIPATLCLPVKRFLPDESITKSGKKRRMEPMSVSSSGLEVPLIETEAATRSGLSSLPVRLTEASPTKKMSLKVIPTPPASVGYTSTSSPAEDHPNQGTSDDVVGFQDLLEQCYSEAVKQQRVKLESLMVTPVSVGNGGQPGSISGSAFETPMRRRPTRQAAVNAHQSRIIDLTLTTDEESDDADEDYSPEEPVAVHTPAEQSRDRAVHPIIPRSMERLRQEALNPTPPLTVNMDDNTPLRQYRSTPAAESSEDEEDDDEDDSSTDADSEIERTNSSRRRRARSYADRYGAEYRQMTRRQQNQFRLEQQHPELTQAWDELEKYNAEHQLKPTDVIAQPDSIVIKLLPFQLEGVAWMRLQEESKYRGGILADEMGMGKTIQTIGLLLSRKHLGGTTLIVAPTVALIQWQGEISRYTKNSLSVCMFHGVHRESDIQVLQQHDVVLTTYSTIESAFRKQEYGHKRRGETIKEPSLLHRIQWTRIVLDEAHYIKDRSCNTARAIFALESRFRWSLSGTPLQNRVGELYSLIRFMRIDPFSYYFCRQCPCKSLHWKFSDRKTCDECGHHVMSHLCWWNNEILKPIQNYGAVGEGLRAFQKLRLLLDRLMLRRTKVERADDLNLPPKRVCIRRDYFSPPELDFYHSLYSDANRQFATYVEQGTVLNNYANIFELLMKLRQSANHPDMLRATRERKNLEGAVVCGMCHEEAEDPIQAKCKHIFCRSDVRQYMESLVSGLTNPTCPVCYQALTIDLSAPAYKSPGTKETTTRRSVTIVDELNMASWRSSTKIEALMEELDQLRRQGQEQGCVFKSLVFSQFVSFLDLVHWRLGRGGWKCVRLDGRMSPMQRDAVIQAFMTDPDITVFLISLKAGGIALNLTEASHVFITDPWWNPAVEDQAMDRIHRLGQYRPIQITRLIVEDSIESRIVQLQEKKRTLFDSTIGKDAAALARLTEEDLRFLFAM